MSKYYVACYNDPKLVQKTEDFMVYIADHNIPQKPCYQMFEIPNPLNCQPDIHNRMTIGILRNSDENSINIIKNKVGADRLLIIDNDTINTCSYLDRIIWLMNDDEEAIRLCQELKDTVEILVIKPTLHALSVEGFVNNYYVCKSYEDNIGFLQKMQNKIYSLMHT
jgi:hypothetical protein